MLHDSFSCKQGSAVSSVSGGYYARGDCGNQRAFLIGRESNEWQRFDEAALLETKSTQLSVLIHPAQAGLRVLEKELPKH